jgi:methionine aminotransferase
VATFTSKFPQLGISIFPVMSALAQEHGAINLAQGFPGFPVSEELIQLVHHYLLKGYNQYSPMPGILRLRELISQKQAKLYGTYFDPETEISIAAGATEAVFSAISAFVNTGDEVILFDPTFDIYPPAIELNGGKVVRIPLVFPEFEYDWEKVKAAISPRTKMILLNSPHNPTGKILTLSDIDTLAELVKDTHILILSDEVYEHMVFDGASHHCLAAHPELKERTLVIASLGKVFHCTGWRIGYCMAPRALSAEFRKAHQFVTFSANTPIQYAMADYLENEDHYLSLPTFFQAKRDLFRDLMAPSPFQLLHSEGSYFQLASYAGLSDLPDVEFAKWLTQTHQVASIPISVFYENGTDNKVIRFCFAKEEEELERAALKLGAVR